MSTSRTPTGQREEEEPPRPLIPMQLPGREAWPPASLPGCVPLKVRQQGSGRRAGMAMADT